MFSQTVSEEDAHTVSASAPDASPPRFGLYLLIVLGLPLLLLLAAFPIARTNYFLHTSRRTLWHGMAYHMDGMAGQNCDVVIFGDSTAMTGVIPNIVQRQTGMSTCNLALAYMGVSATGTMVLDHYLAQNRPPRYIVFLNHYTHLRPPALDEENGILDGWWMVDRYFPPLAAAKFFLRHPYYSYLFAAQVWQEWTSTAQSVRPDFRQRSYWTDIDKQRESHGFMEYNVQFQPEYICRPGFVATPPDPVYIRSLQRYSSAATRVLVYATPIPNCSGRGPESAAAARKAGVPAPLELPPSDFSDDRHLNALGAQATSEYLAKQLQSLDVHS